VKERNRNTLRRVPLDKESESSRPYYSNKENKLALLLILYGETVEFGNFRNSNGFLKGFTKT
jgi:hypothetical protein